MKTELARCLSKLEASLRKSGSLLVAFSGGADSALLLAVALRARGAGEVLAVTVASPLQPEGEVRDAIDLARELGARHRVLELDLLSDPELAANPPGRCYLCKKAIFRALLDLARAEGLDEVIEGTNADDQQDFRPGRRALRELEIRSPLRQAGLTKPRIRELSRALGLPTWNRPAMACLASRVPYQRPLSIEVLRRIDRAEAALWARGLSQVRVRDHDDGELARIEVPPSQLAALIAPEDREALVAEIKAAGYRYVALDLQGYRTGAMNEVLTTTQMEELDEP